MFVFNLFINSNKNKNHSKNKRERERNLPPCGGLLYQNINKNMTMTNIRDQNKFNFALNKLTFEKTKKQKINFLIT